MGTFHDDKHHLHGITVVVETSGSEVWVGRCDDMDEQGIVLLDADTHRDGDGGMSNEEYLRRAAQLGVWKKHDRVRIAGEAVTAVRRLGEL